MMEKQKNDTRKIALYCRVSTRTQTVDNQKLKLLEYATRNNFTFDCFEEVESTRKTRPIKQALMNDCRKGKYKAVIVYKLDRWARSFSELILSVEELINKKIGFISLSENLDFSTSSGQLLFRLLSAFASFERDLISERTLDGLDRVRAEGVTLGRRKGSKDKTPRKRSGYYLREKRKQTSPLKTLAETENL